jgi:hypothetical protein
MKHTFSYPLFHPLPYQLTFIAQPFIFIAPYHTKPQIYKNSGYLTEGNHINTAVKQATEEGSKNSLLQSPPQLIPEIKSYKNKFERY